MVAQHSLFSFFSGAGFLDLGFETEGFNIKYVNEYFPPFLEAYRHARKYLNYELPEYGYYRESIIDFLGKENRNLKTLVKDARRNSDILGFLGGPPCPDFSVGGKNKGVKGDAGRLSAAYVELICKQKPDFFLFENVKGLWKTNKHRAFYEDMKHQFHTEGYVTTERLINAIEYGVPQDRERIILIGFHNHLLADLNIPVDKNSNYLPQDAFPWLKYVQYSKNEVFNLPWPTTDSYVEDKDRLPPNGIIPELTVEYWFRHNDVLEHPNARHHFTPRAALTRFQTIDEGDDSKKSFKRLHRWRYSPTVAYGNNEVHIHPYKPRRISAAEALALQSLPMNFELPANMTLSNMFKTIGNGVPFFAAQALAQSILDFLGAQNYEQYAIDRNRLSVGN